MSDILLSFGVQKGAADVERIRNDINSILSNIDRNPPEVRVGLRVDNAALANFRSQLTQIVNSVSLSAGAPITVNISGLGEITANANETSNALHGVANAARDAGDATREANDRMLAAGTREYNDALTRINQLLIQLRGNQTRWAASASGDASTYYAEIGNQISALEELEAQLRSGELSARTFNTTLSEIRAVATDAAEAIHAVGENHDAIRILTTGTQEYNTALARCYSLLQQISGNQNAWSAARDGSSSAEYASLGASATQINELIAAIRGGNLAADEFAQRFSAINASVKSAGASIKAAGEATRTIAVDAEASVRAEQQRQAALKRSVSLLSKMKDAERNWTAAATGSSRDAYKNIQTYRVALEQLCQRFETGQISLAQFKAEMLGIDTEFIKSSAQIREAGENTKTLSERISGLASKFSAWLSVSQVIMFTVRSIKQMINTVVELDTAMTELKKVTNESDAAYTRFLEGASARAKKLGASMADTVSASADFARLGYNIDDASKLADIAIMYKNIGDGVEDITQATESIVSTMQAFGMLPEDAMHIVDVFNAVGNNFAISSGGIGDALQRSAAAMNAAGNTLEETAALVAAANTVVQNPDSVGTTLKTVSMFLRASKVEAEAAGESTEGMANSVSELRDKLLALTNDRVDILTDSGKYKSTYEILKDIAAVWDDIVSNQGTDSAALLELIGGKRNANVVAAILENFEIAEDALRVATESTGSAIAENEKHLNSIQGTIAKFTAQFESLSATFINSEFVKGIVNFGTVLLQTLEVVGDLVNMLGGLSNVLFTIVGIILTIKIDSIVEKLAGVAGSIKNLTFGMYEAAAGASTLQIALGSLVAVISIISIARTVINKIKQEQAEARQEAIRSAEAASELSDGISDLAIQYASLTEAVKSDASAKESLIATEDALIEKLGLEQYEVNKLKEDYSSLSRAIQETSLAELERQGLDISAGKNARKDELLEAAKEYGLANKSMNNIIVNWTKESAEANHAALNALVEAGYITSSMYSSLGAGLSLPMDGFELDKVDGIIAAHERLGDMLRIVKDEAGDETDVYKALYTEYSRVSKALSNYQNIVGEYNNNLSRQHILQGLINNKMPTTEAEFEQYKDSVVAAVDASGDFVGSAEEIEDVIDGILKNDSSFAGFYAESIGNATSGFKEEAVAVDSLKDKLLELTAAYSKWQAAQSGAESGDIYDDSKQALEQILDGLKSGKVGTEKYKAAVEFLIPEANREDISAYIESLKRYISEDATGVSNFISDAITAGLMVDDGSGNIRIISDATVQDFCNKLKITPDMAQAIFGELEEYGWDLQWSAEDFANPDVDTSQTESELQAVQENLDGIAESADTVAAKVIGDMGASATVVSLKEVVSWMEAIDSQQLSDKHVNVYTHTISDNSGQSSASGTNSAEGGRTLVGELGAELVVSGDRYYLVGQNGAEFVNLKRGDMVFNHVDTQKILAGKSGVRGQALRNGTDPKMAYIGEDGQTILVEVKTDEVIIGGGGKKIPLPDSGKDPDPGPDPGPGSNSDEESWFERQLKDHKHLVEMDKESQSDYLDWLEEAYQKAYEEGIIDIDEFYKYEEEVYKGRRDLVEQAEKDAKSSIDDLVEYRIKMLKQEIEDEKDAVKKKLDALKEFYDKQREMLQDQYDEEKYLEEQAEKRKSVSDIRAELAMLERDDSAWAQKRKLELQEQLAEAEKELNDFERDHALDKTLDMLDEQQASQEALLQAEIDALDEKLNDPHALFNQALADIKNNTEELYNAFIEYNRNHGTGNDEDIADMWEEAYKADLDYQETHNGEHLDDIAIGNYTGYDAPGTTAPAQPESPSESEQALPHGKASDVSGDIGVGSSGEQVRAIQYALNALGFGNSGTQSCDGQFGSGTQTAVRAFQSAMGIISNGTVDASTKAKFRSMGYSMGTRSASPGIHTVDELGPEFVFESSDGNRYRVFRGGEKVLNANATNFLYEFANHGRDILSAIIRSLAGGSIAGKINGVAQVFDIDMGDIIVQGNADSRTVSQIRREQRQSVDYMLKEIGRLKK